MCEPAHAKFSASPTWPTATARLGIDQIRVLIEAALEARAAAPAAELTALVMGGGGTARAACYALRQIGMGTLLVYNRSADKAETLAREFGGQLCPELHAGVAQLASLDVLVSCVPGSAEVCRATSNNTRIRPMPLA